MVLRGLILLHEPKIVCIQETKFSAICNSLAIECLGSDYEYDFIPAIKVAGGVLLALELCKGAFSTSAHFAPIGTANGPWWFTRVYGPQQDADKVPFLNELTQFRDVAPGEWLLCGDFNMIYRVQDKNNDFNMSRLDRCCMHRFRTFLDSVQLQEIHMIGRKFTWSNERGNLTLVLLDRMFASMEWFGSFADHILKPLSNDCSDHCPLLLQLQVFDGVHRRFRFDAFWPKILGFM